MDNRADLTIFTKNFSDLEALRKQWKWFLFMGILMIVLGFLAIGAATTVTLVSVICIGISVTCWRTCADGLCILGKAMERIFLLAACRHCVYGNGLFIARASDSWGSESDTSFGSVLYGWRHFPHCRISHDAF